MSLFLRLCAGWFIDVIILSTWVGVDPMTIELQMIDEEVNQNGTWLSDAVSWLKTIL